MTPSSIRALIFDFDGLIIDSESTDFITWQEVYRSYGLELTFEQWAKGVGSSIDLHDPYAELVVASGHRADREQVRQVQLRRWVELTSQQPLLPGVSETIRQGRQMGLKLAIASSARRVWIDGHLSRFGLAAAFDCICTSEDVKHTKPEPDLYLAALRKLDITADQAVVFEDSANGIMAAKRAGIFAVAVPNPMTQRMRLDGAGRGGEFAGGDVAAGDAGAGGRQPCE